MEPHVAIVILNWSRKRVMLECLEPVSNMAAVNYRIVLVDKGRQTGAIYVKNF